MQDQTLADGLAARRLTNPADGSGRWIVSGPAGIVQYDLLGNHLTVTPAVGGELDSMGRMWADAARDLAVADDDLALFALLAARYRGELAGTPAVDTRTCAHPGESEHDHAMCEDVVEEERRQAATARRCRRCDATTGLAMLPYGPLDPPTWECADGYHKGGAR